MDKPKKISVRPANNLEGEGIVVWVYHRKVQVQMQFGSYVDPNDAINEAVDTWQHAMWKLIK